MKAKTSLKLLPNNYADIKGIVKLNGDEVEIYSEEGEYYGTIFGPLTEKFRQYEGRIIKFRAKRIPKSLVSWYDRGSDTIFLIPHTPESLYRTFF